MNVIDEVTMTVSVDSTILNVKFETQRMTNSFEIDGLAVSGVRSHFANSVCFFFFFLGGGGGGGDHLTAPRFLLDPYAHAQWHKLAA